MYQMKIIAITNGPDEYVKFKLVFYRIKNNNRAILLERKKNDISITTYELPNLPEMIRSGAFELPQSDSESLSNSLPEATGAPANSFNPRLNPFQAENPALPALILNPLGAGDTCCGVFFLEYLDTRVSSLSSKRIFSNNNSRCRMHQLLFVTV
jgi:hypothetical protein